MKKNIDIYLKTLESNMSDIKTILNDLNIFDVPISVYENILIKSSSIIPYKWKTGRKYSRTLFAQRILKEKYPIYYTDISLSIDSMVNILDDLLDESLSKKEKEGYVIEFLRIFSFFNKKAGPEIQALISFYINKLITLAVVENFYQKKIEKKKNIDEITKISVALLMCRGMDFDVFLHVGLLNSRADKISKDKIQEIGRIFRSINILKKDIGDIDHDIKNGQKTMVTAVFLSKKNKFDAYIINLVDLLIKIQENKIKSFLLKNRNKFFSNIIENIRKMTQKEKRDILILLENLRK
ncbi:MAG: hypothetical protein WCZ99_02015 [Candidatus Paceibacterota bacterium]|jgi:hypothetical protein|nr:hypothetical protein [Candidatus Paceibacterota bacterium]MDD3072513.1 hypothetical protein [Candidatus Paceibacterota bacterium]MDD4201654.1 hypothetical protein [Candidatus Paceibacterota bacterium]MDD4467060.1 hypothetical protein [Candidatus Paceibacterota bacterium]MDD4897330.1 hypothetical protein [Candidatus Paceibacterota bacterium]